MDELTLFQDFANNLSPFSSSISVVVGAVISTLFLRANTKTSEFEKIKAGKFKDAIELLLENGKMSYLEFYKCKNFLDIAKKADSLLLKIEPPQNNNQNTEFNFDWYMRFFEAASNIKNEDMQKLWAAVLAGEVHQSGSFSLRTIDTLYNLAPFEAELFEHISEIVLDCSFIFSSMDDIGQEINARYGFDNDSLRILEECGILNGLMVRSQIELLPNERCGFSCGDKLLLIQSKHTESFVFDYNCYKLTMVGVQIFSAIFSKANDNYLRELGREMQSKYPFLNISLHPFDGEENDCITYNSEIDLLKE